MGKALAIVSSLIVIALVIFAINSTKTVEKPVVDTTITSGDRYMEFVKLPSSILAQAGEVTVQKSEIQDSVLKALEQEKIEIAMASAYKQLVLEKDRNADVIFFIKPPKRTLESIFNQYQVIVQSPIAVTFQENQGSDVFIQVDDKKYSFDKIDRGSYLWGALETKIFYRTIDLITAKLINKVLTSKARSLSMNTQEYIEKNILGGERNIASVTKDEKIGLFVKENLLDLPVKVNLKVPSFRFEAKPDWTPSQGDPEALIKVVLFSDFKNQSSRNLLREIPELAGEFSEVYFGFRPLFSKRDRFQRMLAEFGFCAWVSDQEKYWDFIGEAAHIGEQNFEKDLYRVAESKGIDIQPIKNCFFKQEHKQTVDYHLEYAEYLGIPSGPVVFINGEVLTGGITKELIRKVLKRKTWRKSGNI